MAKALNKERKPSFTLIIITVIFSIFTFDLSRNILSLLVGGKPAEFFVLNTFQSLYSFNGTTIVTILFFLATSCWFIISSGLHLSQKLAGKIEAKKPLEYITKTQFRWNREDIIWLSFGSLVTGIIAILLFLPFLHDFPGGDTGTYVDWMYEFENKGFLWALFFQKRPLTSLVLASFNSLISTSNFFAEISLTTTLCVLFSSILLGCFSLLLLRRLGVGKYSSLLCVFASYVMWIFNFRGDLYSNYLAFALMFAFAYFFIDLLEGKKKESILCAVILALIFLIHEPTGYITSALVFLSVILHLMYNRKKLSNLLSPFLVFSFILFSTLLPFLFLTATNPNYLGVFSASFGPIGERYGSFASSDFSIATGIGVDNWDIQYSSEILSGFPNITALCLIILGIILTFNIFRNKYLDPAWIFLESWVLLILSLIVITYVPVIFGTPISFSTYVWRFALILPVPLLLGSLIKHVPKLPDRLSIELNHKISKYHLNRIFKLNLQTICLSALIILAILSLNLSLQYKFYYSESPKPSELTINDSLIMRDFFGYGNDSVIIYAQNNDGRDIEWIGGITGMKVYFGRSLLDLYLGIYADELVDDVSYLVSAHLLEKAGLFANLSQLSKMSIVTTEAFASLDPIEKTLVAKTIPFSNGSQIQIFEKIDDNKYVQNLSQLYSQLHDANVIIGQSLGNEENFWKIYLGEGGNWTASISNGETITQRYRVEVRDGGNYYIRLYHVFENPVNFSATQYLRFVINCSFYGAEKKSIELSLCQDVIAGGASLIRGDYVFTCNSGEEQVVLIPLDSLTEREDFSLSTVQQLILRLDYDSVIGSITMSEITVVSWDS